MPPSLQEREKLHSSDVVRFETVIILGLKRKCCDLELFDTLPEFSILMRKSAQSYKPIISLKEFRRWHIRLRKLNMVEKLTLPQLELYYG